MNYSARPLACALVLACLYCLFGRSNGYALAQIATPSNADTTVPTTFYNFPSGRIIEKFFARSNGDLLVSFSSQPDIYAIDPTQQQKGHLVYTFPGYLSAQGIAEIKPDVFIITLGNYTTAPIYSGQQGSYSIWQLDLTGPKPKGTKIIDVPQAQNLDTIVTSNAAAGLLIAADTTRGLLYRVDVNKPSVKELPSDPLYSRVSPTTAGLLAIGIDGLGISGSYLYFTNFARGLFGRLKFDFKLAVPLSKPSVVYNASQILDGFAFTNDGQVYIAESLEGVILRSQNVQPQKTTLVAPQPGTNGVAFGRTPAEAGFLYTTFYAMATNSSGLSKVKVTEEPQTLDDPQPMDDEPLPQTA